jgi:hypothetical protein
MKFNIRKVYGVVIFLVVFVFCIGTNVYSQSSDFEDFRDQFKNDYFSVGALLQTVGDYQPERIGGIGNNGFSIGNARLQIFGEIDQSFGYQLQANFVKNPSVLDANMYYNITPDFSVKAGLFKSPFSYEFLTGAAAIDFVNRSTVVNQLAPNRQIGLQLGGNLSEDKLRYKVGVFNGNGFDVNRNNDAQFLYMGRLEAHIDIDEEAENKIVFGVNASYEQKDQVTDSGNLRSTFQGEQVLAGSDIRFMHSGLMLSSEFIYSWLESDFGIQSNPFGYHATGGYHVTPKTQFLIRWDHFENDNISTATDSETLLAGLNYFPSSFSEIQLNYIYPISRDIEFSQVLLNLQISL